jgi:caffeoyl-CoA O-methyltransferase
MKTILKLAMVTCLLCTGALTSGALNAQTLRENPELDRKVEKFLEEHAGRWYNLNVPPQDGRLLYDLIIKGNYKRALEIGTSTGHSGIYIAWALSKTSGKLITIEINESSYRTALKNFEEAGLSGYVDARLADAHTLVKELKGPFDFVFSDADKDWYKQYFIDVDPKLVVGGCYTTHNIRSGYGGRRGGGGSQGYYEFVKSLDNYETTLNTDGGGMLISYKIAE